MIVDCTSDMPVLYNALFHNVERKIHESGKSCFIKFCVNSSLGVSMYLHINCVGIIMIFCFSKMIAF